MKRHILKTLIQWKDSKNRKPLILKGTRQVGKTTLLKEFGKQEYTDIAYFNFEEDPGLRDFFEGKLEPKLILQKLGIYRGKKIESNQTLIIFDEIQESNRALNSLKYFQEQSPETHIVAAGSLLGVTLSKPESFPVGKVNFLTLHPLFFFEFLEAVGKKDLCEYLTSKKEPSPLDGIFHKEFVELLKTYLFVGGMPEAVFEYSQSQDFFMVRKIQNEILQSYQLDFSKHATASEVVRILNIWNSIPAQLSKENRKFIFSAVEKSARARGYKTSIDWLQSAGLVHKAHCISTVKVPLSSYQEKNIFKIYLFDVGLLGAMSQLPVKAVIEGDRLFIEFKGALTENYVAQELVAHLEQPLHYWASAGTAEVDFVSEHEGNIFPLEVKAGTNAHIRSLREYGKRFSTTQLSRATLMNFKKDGDVTNYPLYGVRLFPKLSV